MMRDTIPETSWTVHDVVTRCPVAASVFTRFRMACVECAMAPFETLAEAAALYHLKPETLIVAIRRRMQGDEPINGKEG